MSVGITPLAIHVPAIAPIKSNIIRAGVALRILLTIASSSSAHVHLYIAIAIATQMADAAKSANWLPPAMASPP